MAHELKSRLTAIRKLWTIHHQQRQLEAWLHAERRSSYGAISMYSVILFLAAVGVVASSLPSYSAGGGVEAPRPIAAAGGPSIEFDAGCLDVYAVLPDRAEELRRRWRCPVNLNADGSIDHRRYHRIRP